MATQQAYEIHIKNHLDARWLHHFEDLHYFQHPNGETIITGEMDQAKLHGILNRIRDLGLELISVQQIAKNDHRERWKTGSEQHGSHGEDHAG